MDYKIISNGKTTYLETTRTGYELITHSLLNKGMAFTEQERIDFNLLGFLPPHIANIEEQQKRSYEAFKSKPSDIEKYLYLRDLQNSNEILFYNLVCHHLPEMMPIVYTPTVGLGCQQLSHIYRRPRGIYIAYPYQDHIEAILSNPYFDTVKVIVVSDGERILGLGDQGAGGMGIPIGKLALYSACAGIHPSYTLPILLDTGTDNTNLIQDPLYIGWRHERIRGEEYDDFVNCFVQAVKKRFAHVLLQWEDFAQRNANPLLDRYRHQLCTFNDDIQGTASVTVGALLAAIQAAGTHFKDQRIVIVGAGSAGCGIANLMLQAMIETGLKESEAHAQFYLIDRNGLLIEGMSDLLSFQQKFVQPRSKITEWHLSHSGPITLQEVVSHVHPTVLVGVSGQAKIFTEEVLRTMSKNVDRPIIFPLSNPESRCEAEPSDLMNWTNERAIIGTGSPYPEIKKHERLFRVDQTNNCYIFPGVGLGLIAVQAKEVTDKMFMAAAKALAELSPAKKNSESNLLPPFSELRTISLSVAVAVAQEAITSGLAQVDTRNVDLKKYIKAQMFEPEYLPYKKSSKKIRSHHLIGHE